MKLLPVAETARTARRSSWALTAGTTALAWVMLASWGRSPWKGVLDHEGPVGLAPPVGVVVFVGVWTLMSVAMMFPTTAPLVTVFGRLVGGREDRRRLQGALLAGYLSVWAVVGVCAYAADRAVHQLLDGWWVLAGREGVLVGAAVVAAGVYQWTGLKARCLTRCRTPASLIVTIWRSKAPLREAYRVGRAHGVSCVGCCWALMLIMFAVGAGNLAWLLLLSVLMTVEKTAPWGTAATRPMGAALVLAGLAIGMVNA